jgi:hypothetical protein
MSKVALHWGASRQVAWYDDSQGLANLYLIGTYPANKKITFLSLKSGAFQG